MRFHCDAIGSLRDCERTWCNDVTPYHHERKKCKHCRNWVHWRVNAIEAANDGGDVEGAVKAFTDGHNKRLMTPEGRKSFLTEDLKPYVASLPADNLKKRRRVLTEFRLFRITLLCVLTDADTSFCAFSSFSTGIFQPEESAGCELGRLSDEGFQRPVVHRSSI